MKKCSSFGPVAFLMILIANTGLAQQVELVRTTRLFHYPSASTLEFHKEKLYVIGDDATSMLVLDKDHKAVDSIRIFNRKGFRIPKNTKPDLESSIIIHENGKDYLVAFGSNSKKNRNQVIWIDINNGLKKKRALQYDIRHPEVKDWNIEGTALVGKKLVLSNRANMDFHTNYLFVADFEQGIGLGKQQPHAIKLALPPGSKVAGISSISYLKEQDLLLFAASTEDTGNSVTDGAIGISYLGYISGFSKKMNEAEITPDVFFNVSRHLDTTPQKIESIVVEEQHKEHLLVHLAADNDNGQSTLFKLKWTL